MYDPIKSLGQNFLTDINVAEEMVRNLEIASGDNIIEIGPGLGMLTEVLGKMTIDYNFTLTAVEIDSRFIPKLEEMFVQDRNIVIVEDDILNYLPRVAADNNIKILGSLPFYITSPIIHEIIKMKAQPSIAVIMIQKEVAEKIKQTEPDNSYLSVFVQTFFNVDYICTVPRNKFRPQPEVDAGVIKLTKRKSGITTDQIERYEGFLHKAFRNPRKMLNKAFTKAELSSVGIAPTLRPEAVSADKWEEFFLKTCL